MSNKPKINLAYRDFTYRESNLILKHIQSLRTPDELSRFLYRNRLRYWLDRHNTNPNTNPNTFNGQTFAIKTFDSAPLADPFPLVGVPTASVVNINPKTRLDTNEPERVIEISEFFKEGRFYPMGYHCERHEGMPVFLTELFSFGPASRIFEGVHTNTLRTLNVHERLRGLSHLQKCQALAGKLEYWTRDFDDSTSECYHLNFTDLPPIMSETQNDFLLTATIVHEHTLQPLPEATPFKIHTVLFFDSGQFNVHDRQIPVPARTPAARLGPPNTDKYQKTIHTEQAIITADQIEGWTYEMPPPHKITSKLILLTTGETTVVGVWHGELGECYVGWAPMLTYNKAVVKAIIENYRKRKMLEAASATGE